MPSGEPVTAFAPYLTTAKRILDRDAVDGVAAHVVAPRSVQNLLAQLAPLLGTLGVLTLFARSVVLARSQCKALGGLDPGTASLDSVGAKVHGHFATMPEDRLDEGGTILVAAFVAQMSRLLGEDLAMRLIEMDKGST